MLKGSWRRHCQQCVEDPDKGVEDAQLSFDMFNKIRKMQKDPASDQEKSRRFLMDIGDRAANLIKAVKAQEGTIREQAKQRLAKAMRQSQPGLSSEESLAKAAKIPESIWKH
jgi:hypothetical protein